MSEIELKEALDGALDLIVDLKRKARLFDEIQEYVDRELRSHIKHGALLPFIDDLDGSDVDKIYEVLCHITSRIEQ